MPKTDMIRITPRDTFRGARFLLKLPSFFRGALSKEEALKRLSERLSTRESRFLALAQSTVFKNIRSPYYELFQHAGCTFGDLSRIVKNDGLEVALLKLYQGGIFLKIDEFKGRQPIRRGSLEINITPEMLINPCRRMDFFLKSGGSRSSGTPVVFDLDFIGKCAEDTGLALICRGGESWNKATYEVPGGGAMFSLLEFSRIGKSPLFWFSQLNPRSQDILPRYKWGNRAFLTGARLSGTSLSGPIYAPLEDPRPIISWMTDTLENGGTPYLLSYPSSALRVSRAAEEEGQDLSGVQMTIAGEPCTEARMKAIRSTGAVVIPKYAIMETGPLGYGCLNPEEPDDIHFLDDLHGMIQPDKEDDNFSPNTMLFTSLMHTAPFIMINVSMGDQAVVSQRRCSCPMEKTGWTRHISCIRSAEKLTSGGMNFLDSDASRVLDEVLPMSFGGGPSDYQLLEEEATSGEPVLKLLVRPSVGKIDSNELIRKFIHEISSAGGVHHIMGKAWEKGDYLQVERRDPMTTQSGKILHFHVHGKPVER